MKLSEKRVLLDEIDAQISKLLNERFIIIEEIKKIKKAKEIPILDESREFEVINNNKKYVNLKYQESFKEIYLEILKTSKKLQSDE